MAAAPTHAIPAIRAGLLQPLAHGGFALIAGATLISNVGVWMRDTTSAWAVASGSGHGSAVALVQTATTLPIFLLALPSGVLADHFDRRRLLILCQLVLAAAGLALTVLSALHRLGPAWIVGIAFVAGSAAALAAPAFQAIVPRLVPPEEVASAVAISSISFNIARIIGPAIGGAVLASIGPAGSYGCNAAAYLVTIAALASVRSVSTPALVRTPIAFRSELHQGFAFLAASPPLRRIIVRGMALYFCVSCYLALTPLLAKQVLASGSGAYGTLLAATGIGSVAGGVLLSMRRHTHFSDDVMLAGCAVATAVALTGLALASSVAAACAALALAGAATLIQLATLNAAAQAVLPDAIRGRGLAIYMAATFGCMAFGSLLWGAVSDTFSVRAAFALGAMSCLLAAGLSRIAPVAAPAMMEG